MARKAKATTQRVSRDKDIEGNQYLYPVPDESTRPFNHKPGKLQRVKNEYILKVSDQSQSHYEQLAKDMEELWALEPDPEWDVFKRMNFKKTKYGTLQTMTTMMIKNVQAICGVVHPTGRNTIEEKESAKKTLNEIRERLEKKGLPQELINGMANASFLNPNMVIGKIKEENNE